MHKQKKSVNIFPLEQNPSNGTQNSYVNKKFCSIFQGPAEYLMFNINIKQKKGRFCYTLQLSIFNSDSFSGCLNLMRGLKKM